jgi:hypothetical protein
MRHADSSDTVLHRHPHAASDKLRAALEYLGDRLSTHRASRFKPRKSTLLDEWLAARRQAEARPTRTWRSEILTAGQATRTAPQASGPEARP